MKVVTFVTRIFGMEGNTRSRKWVFTYNGYSTFGMSRMLSFCNEELVKNYLFQEELGDNGNKHLQGCIEFKNAMRFQTLKNRFPRCHFEMMKAKTPEYCGKFKTRNGAAFSCEYWEEYIMPDPWKGRDLDLWEKDLIWALDCPPDHRTVFWLYDIKGCFGKSRFVYQYDDAFPGECMLVTGGKKSDVAYAVNCMKNRKKLRVVFFNIGMDDRVNFKCIEMIKDLFFFSPKYESGRVKLRNPVHVVVFCNYERPIGKLAEDRFIDINLLFDY